MLAESFLDGEGLLYGDDESRLMRSPGYPRVSRRDTCGVAQYHRGQDRAEHYWRTHDSSSRCSGTSACRHTKRDSSSLRHGPLPATRLDVRVRPQ